MIYVAHGIVSYYSKMTSIQWNYLLFVEIILFVCRKTLLLRVENSFCKTSKITFNVPPSTYNTSSICFSTLVITDLIMNFSAKKKKNYICLIRFEF